MRRTSIHSFYLATGSSIGETSAITLLLGAAPSYIKIYNMAYTGIISGTATLAWVFGGKTCRQETVLGRGHSPSLMDDTRSILHGNRLCDLSVGKARQIVFELDAAH